MPSPPATGSSSRLSPYLRPPSPLLITTCSAPSKHARHSAHRMETPSSTWLPLEHRHSSGCNLQPCLGQLSSQGPLLPRSPSQGPCSPGAPGGQFATSFSCHLTWSLTPRRHTLQIFLDEMEKPNKNNNKTDSAGMQAYSLEAPLPSDARCQSCAHPAHVGQQNSPIHPWGKVPSPHGLTVQHFNNYDNNRTLGCGCHCPDQKLPEGLWPFPLCSSTLKRGIRRKGRETQDAKTMAQLWSLVPEVLPHACGYGQGINSHGPGALLGRTGRLLPSSGRPGGRVQHSARAWHRAGLVDGSCHCH